MHHIGLPPRLALTCPSRGKQDLPSMQPLTQPLTELREEYALGVITSVRQAPMDRDMSGNVPRADD